jgi:hypothetical protein
MPVKYPQSIGKVPILFALITVFALLPALVCACLPAEDIVAIYGMEESLNMTGHPLYSIMEAQCLRYANATAPDMSLYATKTEIAGANYISNASMNDFVTYPVMDSRISSAMSIISQANVEGRVDAAMANYTDNIEAKFNIDQLLWYVINNTEKLMAGTDTTAWASQTDIQNVNSYVQSHESRLSSLEAAAAQQKEQGGFNPAWAVGGIIIFICAVVAYQFYFKPRAEASRYPHIATPVPAGVAENFDDEESSRSLGTSMMQQMGLGHLLQKPQPKQEPAPIQQQPATAPQEAPASLSEEDLNRLAERIRERTPRAGPPARTKSILPARRR